MRLEGGCYCGAVRYVAAGEPVLRAQCHCRACQHISGGAPNLFMLMRAEGFTYTKGAPETYTRPDKADAVTREFCAVCGTHMISRRPGLRKRRSSQEGQPFHLIADGVPAFEALPPRRERVSIGIDVRFGSKANTRKRLFASQSVSAMPSVQRRW